MAESPNSDTKEKSGLQHVERLDSLITGEAGLDTSSVGTFRFIQRHLYLHERQQPNYDDAETKRILHKVDWRLMPILALLYLLAFLDRGNIANAKVAGMNVDLGLTGAQYNMALTVFFFPYAVLEVPSNIVLKLMRPSLWISILMVLWGIVMTLQGIVQSYEHLIVTRVLLGVFGMYTSPLGN